VIADKRILTKARTTLPQIANHAKAGDRPSQPAAAADGPPWLVLTGRSCCTWGAELQQLQGLAQQLLLLLSQGKAVTLGERLLAPPHAAEVVSNTPGGFCLRLCHISSQPDLLSWLDRDG
jgi:hypothetical protein